MIGPSHDPRHHLVESYHVFSHTNDCNDLPRDRRSAPHHSLTLSILAVRRRTWSGTGLSCIGAILSNRPGAGPGRGKIHL